MSNLPQITCVCVYYPHWHRYPKGDEWFGADNWGEGEWGAVYINGWNEYTEGTYLLPDAFDGDARLRAIAAIFGGPA